MVSSRGLSALVCAAVGLVCAASAVRGRGGDQGAVVRIAEAAPAAARPEAAPPARAVETPAVPAVRAAAADVDTALPTGSIAPGSALHQPNPLAYRGAAKAGDPVTVTGEEAINYLAGNTLRREAPGGAPNIYFASRGLLGEGDERSFTARRWERERPELCEAGPDGATPCRTVSILLDGKYEFPGARLGTVTLGAAGGRPAETAALIKGNAIRFPDHVPLLDSAVGAAAEDARPPAGDPVAALAGRVVAAAADGERGRQLVFYGADDRRLELRQVQAGDGRAVEVTVGHWHAAKGGLCQARVVGGPQSCFRAEAGAAGVRLVPAGKTGEAQTLAVLPEVRARELAQD